MTPQARSSAARTAYPDALRDAEIKRWTLGLDSRYGQDPPPDAPQVGVALSGGGIRSATFSLGVFQAFAARGFLKHIDFLSTISGGGYFGAFFGGLFARDYIRSAADVAGVLSPDATSTEKELPEDLIDARQSVVAWLRENGRYLSPRGAGDTLLFLSALFRNWVALNFVIALLAVTIALAMQLPRFIPWVDAWVSGLPGDHFIWWSPWIASAVLPALFVPSMVWAYWLRDDGSRKMLIGFAATFVLAALIGAGYFFHWPWIGHSRAALTAAAAMLWIAAWAGFFVAGTDPDLTRSKNHLSQWLKVLLVASVCLLTAGIIDSLGQTVYFTIATGDFGTWIAFIGAFIAGVAAFSRQITVLIGSKASGDRARLPVAVIAVAGAAALVTVLATAYDATAHAVAWGFDVPKAPAALLAERGVVTMSAPDTVKVSLVTVPREPQVPRVAATRPRVLGVFGWLVAFAGLTWAFGRSWGFVNGSAQQPIYAARLARAYLGASNPERWRGSTVPVIDPLPGDDFEMAKYWPPLDHDGKAQFAKGAPLHIVSVTINATVGSRSQIEQRDRKGIGMAIGPAGLSAGVRHHAVFQDPGDAGTAALPPAAPVSSKLKEAARRTLAQVDRGKGFNAFDYDSEEGASTFPGETLSLAKWTSISGAAFSTGLGSRTNLGLSLLTGFMNVRLGYWWTSGARLTGRKSAGASRRMNHALGRTFEQLLPVHKYLADEFLAHFPGVSRKHWYLSDGGHFENLGGYELIRRRVPLAIMVDVAEDAEFVFNDLGNFVRKARSDFGAEIRFLTREQLEKLGITKGHAIGTLDDLRPDCDELAECEKEAETERPYSHAYAALAAVTYEGADPAAKETTFVLYIKPALIADEPADLINYGRAHQTFPHETTADQFFDEAQWESYRKLGEVITLRVWRDLGFHSPKDLLARLHKACEA